MLLRFTVKAALYLVGPSSESVSQELRFTQRGVNVVAQLEGEPPETFESRTEPADRYSRRIRAISFLFDDGGAGRLTEHVKAGDYKRLLTLVVSTANLCIGAIRSVGWATSIHELPPPDVNDPESAIGELAIQFSEDGSTWHYLITSPTARERAGRAIVRSWGSILPADRWPLITEKVEDGQRPEPEEEFTVNCLEHLREGNLRLAVVEAIIGLEIVIARYLRTLFEVERRASKAHVDRLLSPEFGLNARLSMLFGLSSINSDALDAAVRVAAWRNVIVHREGHLPDGVTPSTVRDSVRAILELTLVLAANTAALAAAPELRIIADAIQNEHKLVRVSLRRSGRHAIEASVSYPMLESDSPTAADQDKIVRSLAERLKARDSRFEAQEHLVVEFRFGLLSERPPVRWKHGGFESTK